MRDQSVVDSAYAAKIFIGATVLLLFGAFFELNAWPTRRVLWPLFDASLKNLFSVLSDYGVLVVVLFWAARPKLQHQRIVLFSWPLLTALLWFTLDSDLHFRPAEPAAFYSASLLLKLLTAAHAIPALLLLVLRLVQRGDTVEDSTFEKRLRYFACLLLLFTMVPEAALSLTFALHPATYDMYALRWDHAAGLDITPWLIGFIDAVPCAPQLMYMAYSMTPLGFMAVALLHLRGKPHYVASGLLTWVGLTICALVAYNFFPITGPKYVFGQGGFETALRTPARLLIDTVIVGPAPRNGMPSMHFGWMLVATILWWRSGTTWKSRALLCCMTALTAMATLYTGEHYVVDLIVAVPFVLSAIALCTTSIPWSLAERRYAVYAGFAAWAAWVVLLRTLTHWLVDHAWACWIMIIATAFIAAFQARCLARFSNCPDATGTSVKEKAPLSSAALFERRVGLMFFASGAAALVYQVLFAKKLALVFGSTATATFTVLATFLGGMAIGSLVGSRLAVKVKRPLTAYAVTELLIAVYCVLTPALFDLVQHIYVALAAGHAPGASILLVLRVALGAFVLLVPTVLMGATLPLLTQELSARLEGIGAKVAWLYFANTAGAATGALLTSYVVIPVLGAWNTTLIAAVLNLLVVLGALELAKHAGIAQGAAALETGTSAVRLPKNAASAALLSLCVGGILSLGLEVVYVHMLSIVAGNSVYAFGLMLATFLLGLAGGGETARRLLLNPDNDRARLLFWTLLGLAATVAAGVWWWNDIPEYFGSFAKHPVARSFISREAIRGVVCALLMVPPTFFIGAAYAFGMDIATAAGKDKPVAMLGVGAALNTLGNITGVLVFGFGLLPILGGLNSTRVIAVGALILGVTILVITSTRLQRRDLVMLSLTGILIGASFFSELNYNTLSSGANVYFSAQQWGKVVDHAESIDGGLTTVAETVTPQGTIKTLLTNGKFQGNDAWKGEMQAQLGFALASLLHQDKREHALVIGYGTGVTSRVFHEAGFKSLDIAELSRDVIRLADTHFGTVNNRVSSAPGVHLHVTDGRNLLLLSERQKPYDVVSIEITSIWFAGAASLYNREFYDLVRSRMAPDGVLQQWVQLHHLAATDLLTIVATLRSEFRYVSLYIMGSQGILIATNDEQRRNPVQTAIHALESANGLSALRQVLDKPVVDFTKDRFLNSEEIDRFIKEIGVDDRIWWSTDNNLSLEYSTPKANANDGQWSYLQNLNLLSRFQGRTGTNQSGKQ